MVKPRKGCSLVKKSVEFPGNHAIMKTVFTCEVALCVSSPIDFTVCLPAPFGERAFVVFRLDHNLPGKLTVARSC